MMKIDYYQINAFTESSFGGNPAGVCPLTKWLASEQMQAIARENGLAETAFFVKNQNQNRYEIRWFTPEFEMDLCGHATLATAYVIKHFVGDKNMEFSFDSVSGPLIVNVQDSKLVLDFPSRIASKGALPNTLLEGLDRSPIEVLKARDYVLVYENEEEVRQLKVDQTKFDTINIDPAAVVATAPGLECDFVSRVFTPQASVFEDPVTGSTHCSLIPYWSRRLQKKKLYALQLSERLGELFCEDLGERVLIGGHCKLYLVGQLYI